LLRQPLRAHDSPEINTACPPSGGYVEQCLQRTAGTDATRVASCNPWVSLAWLVTERTVGDLRIYPQRNCLDRETALRMWTENVTWFSNEEGNKGRIEVGQLADLIVPDRDYFACAESEIADRDRARARAQYVPRASGDRRRVRARGHPRRRRCSRPWLKRVHPVARYTGCR
jgi:cytosine/adenosine deaminase-related metal-dependent hydrolase